MKWTLVLDPGFTFAQVEDTLGRAGWRVADRGASPLLPGEPEYAVLERANPPGNTAERLHYTFNPVCHLRVVEVDADGASVAELAALPLVRPETAASWLTEADDRTVLRGVLAAHHLGDPGLLDRVEACRDHARPAIAEAASRSADALRRAMESRTPEEGAARQAQARTRAMASLAVLEEQLEPLLRGLGRDADGRIAAGLRPVPDDYGLAFLPQYAEAACKAYEPIWEKEPRVRPVPSNAVVRCHVAPAGMLGHDNELSFHFPGGYRHVAQLLDPHRVWARWTYLRPGASAGQSYDGLVWLDDHWAWFPKPFRALRALVVDDHPPS